MVTALVLADQSPLKGDESKIDLPHALVGTGSEDVGMLLAIGADGLPAAIESMLVAKKPRGAGMRSPANRFVCPHASLPDLRRALFRDDCTAKLLASHLVSAEAHAALLSGDLEQFFEIRRVTIRDAEIRWVEQRGGRVDLQPESRTYIQG